MPKIQIDTPSNLEKDETFLKLKDLFENDSELKKLDSSYICNFDKNSLSGTAKGKKFDALMQVLEKSVSISIKIPMLLSPLKGKIKSTVEKKLTKLLA